MRVYVDVSCLDRPFDDQWQERVRLETEAMLIVFEHFEEGRWDHVSSDMVAVEISAMPDKDRRRRVRSLLPHDDAIAGLSKAIHSRAGVLVNLGFGPADAVHIAAAESQKADILLTCDDKLLRRARRLRDKLGVEVENPVVWIRKIADE
jgi:predicted nucleic acid-binding protein